MPLPLRIAVPCSGVPITVVAAAGLSKLSALAPLVPVSGLKVIGAVLLVVMLSATISDTAVTLIVNVFGVVSNPPKLSCTLKVKLP